MFQRVVSAFAFVGLAVLGACGGSGGGGGGPPVPVVLDDQILQGTYFAVLKLGKEAGGPLGAASTGPFSAGGTGLATHTYVMNQNGALSGPTTSAYEYDVAADGSFELRLFGTPVVRGGVSADGECALGGSISPGGFPGFMVLRRRGGFHTLASLSGPYHVALMQTATAGGASVTLIATANFDGAGSVDLAADANFMGTVRPVLVPPLAYTVSGDGTSVFDPAGFNAEGGVVAGGAMALWAGSRTAGNPPVIAFALKAATSASLATFQGEYWIVCLARSPSSLEFRSLNGTVTADGAGGMTLFSVANTEGTITSEPPQATTYTVGANGKFGVEAGGSGLQGGISQDGKYAILSGGTVAGSEPTICVLCRK